MKLFKKAVSVFLALLMIFGSVSLLATAAGNEIFHWSVDTKFYRQVGDEWVETTKVAKGEKVKARVFITTEDFAIASSAFIWTYPTEFLRHDTSEYAKVTGGYGLLMNDNPDSKVAQAGLSGFVVEGVGSTGKWNEMVEYGVVTPEDIGNDGWIFTAVDTGDYAIQLDGSEWYCEFNFVVVDTPTGNGQFYLPSQAISTEENFLALTFVAACENEGPGTDYMGEYWTNWDPDGFWAAPTLNDTDADSTLSCDNTVVFTAGAKVAEYTGFIGEPLSSIAGFSVPSASADGQEFLGWSLDGSTVMSDDEVKAVKVGYETVELKAVFQAAAASYTQNVYTMDVNGNYGAAVEASIGSAPGTVVNAASYSVPAGFTLDATKSSGDKTVEADGSTVVDIYLERNKYNATFGTVSTPVYYEATYTAPAGADTDTGIFEYWVNAADESVTMNAGDTAVMGLADVTYTAKYKAVYDVIYTFAGTIPEGVEVPAASKVTAGEIIAKPAVEVPAGYNLVWTANGATANEDGTFTAGAGNVTITGTWAKIPYTVTYVYADNGNIPAGYTAPAATTLTIGETITAPAVEIPAGYKLDWDIEGDVIGAADVTMTGTWSKIPYTVTYKFSGEAPVSAPAAVTATIGVAIALPELEAEGWTFNGWTVTGANGADGNYTVGASDVTVTGSWTKNVYVVNYWLDEDMTDLYDSYEFNFGDEVIYPDDPTDDYLTPGKYFETWDYDFEYIDEDIINDGCFVEDPDVPGRYVCDNVASLVDYEYTIRVQFQFSSSAGSYTVDKTDEAFGGSIFYYGDVITADDLPATEEEGYQFTGWTVSLPYTVTKDALITGRFQAKKFNATFDANGGAWLNGDTERTFEVDYGTDIVAPFEDPVYEGYHLAEVKWGAELGTMLDEDVTFYAEWEPNEYVLTFVVEGETIQVAPQEFGGKIAAPAVPDKAGYDFAGWTADGGTTIVKDLSTVDVPSKDTTYTAVYVPSAGGVDYKVNRYFMNTKGEYEAADTITLHAVAETEVTYNAEFDGFTLNTAHKDSVLTAVVKGDGTTVLEVYYDRNKITVNVNGTEGEYFQGEEIDLPDAPEEEGKTFDHWVDENGNTVTDPYVVPNEEDKEVTLTPVYTNNEYTATFIISAEGTTVTYTTTKAKYTESVVVPADPTAEVPAGYIFKGWAKTEGATEALADLGNMPVNGITFYAVLASETDVEYTIEKYFMGLDKTYAIDATKTVVGTDGTAGAEKTLTLDADEFEGFTLNTAHADSVLTAVVKGDGTTVFKAYYDRDTVKVTINGDETEKFYGEEITEDDMPAHPTAPEGMEPDGWVYGDGDPVEFPVKVGTEDIVIVPDYKASEFVITFMNGDAVAQTGKQTYGEILAVPAAPSLTGYTFDGWYANGVKVEVGTTTVPAAATTYTAKFTPNNYTVTFTADGATVASGEYAFGTKISTILPEYTAPAGYAFTGWSLNGVDVIEFTDDVTVPAADITYVAVKNAVESAYTVETYVMNVNGTTYAKTAETLYALTETVINYTVADKTGFTPNEEKSVLTGEVTGDGQMKIRVYYDRNKYNVTVDGALGAEVYYEGTYTTPDASSATGVGYSLTGWTDGVKNYDIGEEIVVTDNIALTAVNTPNKYTVTFKVKGATFATGEYDFGTAIVNPGAPTVEGYTFTGWAKNGTPVDLANETVPANNVTYTAILVANTDTAYTVYKVFQNTDGDWDEAVADVRYGTTGATIEIDEDAEAVEGFSISEIDYVNNTIAADGSAEVYIYYERNIVTITINGEEDEYLYGEEIAAPAAPAKEGYTFKGWEDADGNAVTFPIEATVDGLVIKPVFAANEVSLSFVVDGVAVEGYPTTATVDSVITAPAAPKKDGYNFVDWYIQGTNIAFNGKMPTTDTVYEARFTAGANTKFAIEIYTMNTQGTYDKTVTYSFGVTETTAWVEPSTDLPGLTPNLEKSKTSDVVKANGSTVLSIYYDRDLYTVTWVVDGAETTANVYYGAEIVAPAAPAKDGYTFAGWTPEVPATMPEKDLKFTAQWDAAAYNVIYVENGKTTTESYAYGATVTVKDAARVEGMTFIGWFADGVEYVAGTTFTMPANDIIIVADYAVSVYKVTYLNAEGGVFTTAMVECGDEIPVPTTQPTKKNHVFIGWNIVHDTMPEMDITVEPIFERIDVELVAKTGSTTIINRETNIITGLQEYITVERILRDTYLEVVGDGFFTVTPVAAMQYGTGTKIELYDNADPSEPIETYVIVIYGDINGDSVVTPVDSTFASDEGLMITNWSEETVYDAASGTMVANPNYDPYKVMAADINGDGIIDATDATIIGDTSIGIYRINQVTGKPE